MTSDWQTVMITGHRPDKLHGNATWVRGVLGNLLDGFPRQWWCLSGMAQGADTIWVEEALSRRIPVHAAVPFEGQDARWPQHARQRYRDLLEAIQTSPLGMVWLLHHGPPASRDEAVRWLHERNAWMVERADSAIAVWDGSRGGTGHAVGLLRASQVPWIRVDPKTRTVNTAPV